MAIENAVEEWLDLIARRRAVIARTMLSIIGLVIIASLVLPPVFRSSSEILVEANRAQLLISPGLQAGTETNQPTALSGPVTEADLNSECELLTSRYLIERTVEKFKNTDRQPGSAARAFGWINVVTALPQYFYNAVHQVNSPSGEQELVLKLMGKLQVGVIKRSNVIEVSFKSNAADWSQKFLSQLLDQYLELHAFISHDPKAERFFLQQADLLDQRLRRSEEALRAAQLQSGITDFGAQKAAMVTEYYNLEAREQKNSADLAASQKQVNYIQQQMVSVPQRRTKESQVVQNMALQTLKPQVLQLEAQRAELLSRYQPTSKKIRDIDAQLEVGRRILSREKETEVHQTTTDLNPTWAALDTTLAQTRYQIASLQANGQALIAQIADYRGRLDKLSSDGLIMSRLQRQVDNDKEAYVSYLRKGEEARAAEALNQTKILNVSIVAPASFPIKPDSPNMRFNLAIGVLFGLMLGMASAYYEDKSDQKLHSANAVAEIAGIPVVAVVEERG